MSIQLYSSTDTGAPVLNGTASAMIGVLDACLVNGYGSRTSLGWTKAFSGADLAAYQMPSGSTRYLRIDDSATTLARIKGFDTMSDVNTGTNPFPSVAQIAAGAFANKTDGATAATARQWIVIGSSTYFYFWNQLTLPTNTSQSGTAFFFGDIVSLGGGLGNTAIIANQVSLTSGGSNITAANDTVNNATVSSGHWMSQPYAGGTSQTVSKHYAYLIASAGISGGDSTFVGPSTPDRITGGITFTPFWLVQPTPTRILRGYLPGSLAALNFTPLAHGTKFQFDYTGGTQAGKKYIYLDTRSAFGLEQGFAVEYNIDGILNAQQSSYFLMFGD
jgi:hypothetical protein